MGSLMKSSWVVFPATLGKFVYMQISAPYRNMYFIQYCQKCAWYCNNNGAYADVFMISG